MATSCSGLRSVVIHEATREMPANARQLLSNSGMEVETADSPEQAHAALCRQRADLVLVDVDSPRAMLAELAELPEPFRPRHVAVLCDQPGDLPMGTTHQPGMRLHVFPRALHLHGLVGLLRRVTRPVAMVG